VRAAHAEEGFVADHERTEVKAGLIGRRHPVTVDRDQLLQRFDEDLHRQFRQRQALRRTLKATAVGIRTESPD